jgi:hypothetical protein
VNVRHRLRFTTVVSLSLAVLMAGVILFRPSIAYATDPVTVDQSTLTFAGTGVGSQSAAQTLTYTNNGTVSATITTFVIASVSDGGAAPFAFDPVPAGSITLAPLQSYGVEVVFAPTSVGTVDATVTATVTSQNPIITTVTGTGLAPTLVATPDPVVVGNVAYSAGQTVTAGVTLTNSSTSSTIHITAISIGGANPSYYTDQPAAGLPVALGPGAATSVTISYTPPAAGAFPATLLVTSDDPVVPTQEIALQGEVGDPALTPNAASIVFPDTGVGATAMPQTLLVTNAGYSALTISGLTSLQNVTVVGATDGGAVTTDFSIVPPAFPLTLTPNASVSLTVSYTPLTGGTQLGAFSFTTNDPMWPPTGSRAVSITGMAMGNGDSLMPSSLSFTTPVGAPLTESSTFFSSAALPVAITSLAWMGDSGAFTVVDGGAVNSIINPTDGGTSTIYVQFAPTQAEVAVSDTLIVGLNDPAQSYVALPVTGFGAFVGEGGILGDGGEVGDGGLGDDGGSDDDAGCPLCTSGGDACTCSQVGGVDRALAVPLVGAGAFVGLFMIRRKRRNAASRRSSL